MSSQDELSTYYKHWDYYVYRWARGKFPDQVFMPEPWWGWTPDSKEVLHSVVINLNPGQGGKLQTHQCVNCMLGCLNFKSYSESMDLLRHHLAPTERWHLNRRYKPIMLALGADKKDIAPTTRHHLSIELLPNHVVENFSEELENKASEIYKNVLCFAAEASKRIVAPPFSNGEIDLNKIVLIRSHPKHIRSIIGEIYSHGNDIIPETERNAIFKLNEVGLEDVTFICIAGTRNNFPKNLDEILKDIINEKNKNNEKNYY